MKCLVCGKDATNEVCNNCIRMEKILYQKEWSHKAGILSRNEDYRVAVSNLRISGRLSIGDNDKGMNTRIDNFSHYLLNVGNIDFSGKDPKISIQGSGDAKYSRYLYLPGFSESPQLKKVIDDAREKAAALTERIRQSSGMTSPSFTPSTSSAPRPAPAPSPAASPAAPSPSISPAASPAAAPAPASVPLPNSADTMVLAGIAEDINEFETKIKKLKVLRDNGILSDEEYEAEKKKLVSIF